MENWIKRILLARAAVLSVLATLTLLSFPALAEDDGARDDRPLIKPDVRPKKVNESLIDTENFEVGIYGGFISIEDFESSALYGLRVAYHLSEGLFIEGNYALAEAGQNGFERLSAVDLLSDEDRDYSYYNVSIGYNFLPGEGFFDLPFSDTNYAFNTNFYFVGGLGATEFAGDSETTINFGWGYQILFKDWFAWHFVAREHIFSNELLGEEKTNFNPEFSSGISIFF